MIVDRQTSEGLEIVRILHTSRNLAVERERDAGSGETGEPPSMVISHPNSLTCCRVNTPARQHHQNPVLRTTPDQEIERPAA